MLTKHQPPRLNLMHQETYTSSVAGYKSSYDEQWASQSAGYTRSFTNKETATTNKESATYTEESFTFPIQAGDTGDTYNTSSTNDYTAVPSIDSSFTYTTLSFSKTSTLTEWTKTAGYETSAATSTETVTVCSTTTTPTTSSTQDSTAYTNSNETYTVLRPTFDFANKITRSNNITALTAANYTKTTTQFLSSVTYTNTFLTVGIGSGGVHLNYAGEALYSITGDGGFAAANFTDAYVLQAGSTFSFDGYGYNSTQTWSVANDKTGPGATVTVTNSDVDFSLYNSSEANGVTAWFIELNSFSYNSESSAVPFTASRAVSTPTTTETFDGNDERVTVSETTFQKMITTLTVGAQSQISTATADDGFGGTSTEYFLLGAYSTTVQDTIKTASVIGTSVSYLTKGSFSNYSVSSGSYQVFTGFTTLNNNPAEGLYMERVLPNAYLGFGGTSGLTSSNFYKSIDISTFGESFSTFELSDISAAISHNSIGRGGGKLIVTGQCALPANDTARSLMWSTAESSPAFNTKSFLLATHATAASTTVIFDGVSTISSTTDFFGETYTFTYTANSGSSTTTQSTTAIGGGSTSTDYITKGMTIEINVVSSITNAADFVNIQPLQFGSQYGNKQGRGLGQADYVDGDRTVSLAIGGYTISKTLSAGTSSESFFNSLQYLSTVMPNGEQWYIEKMPPVYAGTTQLGAAAYQTKVVDLFYDWD